jgi:hypothetical protein
MRSGQMRRRVIGGGKASVVAGASERMGGGGISEAASHHAGEYHEGEVTHEDARVAAHRCAEACWAPARPLGGAPAGAPS